MGYLSFASLILWLSAYWIVERSIKIAYQHFAPNTYIRLHHERIVAQYFVFIMGILITLLLTPLCLQAYDDSSNTNDTPGSNHLSPSGQLCLLSRGVLWASELNRLDHSSRYVLHHLSSLAYLSYHLENTVPLRPLYLIYASLVTELLGDTAALLTLHGKTPETSIVAYGIHVVNLFMITVIRVPACLYAVTYIPMYSISDVHFYLNLLSVGVYTWYNINTIIAISSRLWVCQPRLVENEDDAGRVREASQAEEKTGMRRSFDLLERIPDWRNGFGGSRVELGK